MTCLTTKRIGGQSLPPYGPRPSPRLRQAPPSLVSCSDFLYVLLPFTCLPFYPALQNAARELSVTSVWSRRLSPGFSDGPSRGSCDKIDISYALRGASSCSDRPWWRAVTRFHEGLNTLCQRSRQRVARRRHPRRAGPRSPHPSLCPTLFLASSVAHHTLLRWRGLGVRFVTSGALDLRCKTVTESPCWLGDVFSFMAMSTDFLLILSLMIFCLYFKSRLITVHLLVG